MNPASTMEKYAMVKTEVQPNGDIFLFYMDENGAPIENTDGVINTIDPQQLQQLQENFVIAEMKTETYEETMQTETQYEETIQANSENTKTENQSASPEEAATGKERWLDEETEKLLIFYVDNKQAFQNPSMKNKHLWSVACKTMLVGKTASSCEMKVRNLKRKYYLLHLDHLQNNNNPRLWPFYDLCNQAFHDDSFIQKMLQEGANTNQAAEALVENMSTSLLEPRGTTVAVKRAIKTPDEKVRQMLELYLRYKTESASDYLWHKKVWEKIALQIGEDAEFWHKRFLNYKQHYIRMLDKRKESGPETIIAWPYMQLYDQIFQNDAEFKRKYGGPIQENIVEPAPPQPVQNVTEWNNTEKTVLVKYHFDCLDEFQDPSIPNGFLWNEVGRLLDKEPEACRNKYEELRKEHLKLYTAGGYNLQNRNPLAILFDNIISQEVERMFCEPSTHPSAAEMQWEVEKTDNMVQFLFDNIDLFKDPICHFVCWPAVADKLNDKIQSCKEQWNDLTALYKTILNDKKEDSDLQIDWRYIDIFDRIFDYGMDTKLLEGYESKKKFEQKTKKIIQAKQQTSEPELMEDAFADDYSDLETEEFDDKTTNKRSRGIGDPKQIKILEYYLKYKDKFTTTRKKNALWESLATTIGISAEQCAHRFRNLKQVYMAYVQREIDKPDKPILWPYFATCKKAFGYRMLKNKLKQTKLEIGEQDEWTPKEIKLLINYFGQNYQDISQNPEDLSKWKAAKDIMTNKSVKACRDKFLELSKSYRKMVAMMKRNPDSKINWKYFKFLHEIYSKAPADGGGVETEGAGDAQMLELPPHAIKTELQDNDLQCIIVIPEGEEANNVNTQIIINPQNNTQEPTEVKITESRKFWQKEDKQALLETYLEYITAHEGEEIETAPMWKEIASRINRSVKSCKRVFAVTKTKLITLKNEGKLSNLSKSPLLSLMEKIIEMKPKFVKTPLVEDDSYVLNEETTYKDVTMPLWKVEKALKYYLEHIEEFISPKYDKKYAWYNLSKAVETISMAKLFSKINYLKQFFNSETNEVNGEKFQFADLLKEVLEKEFICRVAMGNIPESMNVEEDTEPVVWTDDETEQLLIWYLENLHKFKNPLYVPSYLWMEASNVLHKSAVACSKKMTEIRSQYSAMAKENSEQLNSWRFYELCQKIYGTGKKNIEEDEQYLLMEEDDME